MIYLEKLVLGEFRRFTRRLGIAHTYALHDCPFLLVSKASPSRTRLVPRTCKQWVCLEFHKSPESCRIGRLPYVICSGAANCDIPKENVMQFALLIYESPEAFATRKKEENEPYTGA